MNPLVKSLSIASGVYGAAYGLQVPPRVYRNTQEAADNSTVGSLLLNLAKDTTLAFLDDALILASPLLLKKGGASGLAKAIENTVLVGGAGVAGAIATHDIQNFVQARRYLGERGMDASQLNQFGRNLVPDRRINRIEGFHKGGTNAQRRSEWAGINSPTSSGLEYRMFNNPFSKFLSQFVTEGDPNSTTDPRTTALTYGYAGGLLGGMIGGRFRGLSGAALGGIVGSATLGALGIYKAHNPSSSLNAEATYNVIKTSALPLLAAGALFGLTRIPRIGPKMGGLLSGTNELISKAGNKLDQGILRARSSKALSPGIINPASSKLRNFPSQVLNKTKAATDYTLGLTQSSVVPFLKNTGPAGKSMWEQSIGFGNLISWAPTHLMIGAIGADIYRDHHPRQKQRANQVKSRVTSGTNTNRRGASTRRKSSNSMPSNR